MSSDKRGRHRNQQREIKELAADSGLPYAAVAAFYNEVLVLRERLLRYQIKLARQKPAPPRPGRLERRLGAAWKVAQEVSDVLHRLHEMLIDTVQFSDCVTHIRLLGLPDQDLIANLQARWEVFEAPRARFERRLDVARFAYAALTDPGGFDLPADWDELSANVRDERIAAALLHTDEVILSLPDLFEPLDNLAAAVESLVSAHPSISLEIMIAEPLDLACERLKTAVHCSRKIAVRLEKDYPFAQRGLDPFRGYRILEDEDPTTRSDL